MKGWSRRTGHFSIIPRNFSYNPPAVPAPYTAVSSSCSALWVPHNPLMTAERRKLISLVATVILVALVVAVVSILHLYRTALAMERKRLNQTVESQVLLIGAVARFDAVHSQDANPEGATGATISQIRDAYQHFQWFGDTGEILIARLTEGRVEYINQLRDEAHSSLANIPDSLDHGLPMRLALEGQSGIMIARDYRNEMVLASYAPIADLDIGLVAKIDMAEINAPYVRSAMIVGVGAVAIAIAGLLLVSAAFPLIRRAETANDRERRNLLAIFDSIDEPIHVSDPLTHELLYVNEAFKRYWGEGFGQPCHAVINGRDHPCADCTSPKIFGANTGDTCSREWLNETTGLWFRSLAKAIHWPGQQLVRYEMAINITAERQAQKAIIEQQEKVRALSSQLSLSEEQERKRLATQLHDQIGHAMVTAKMKLVNLQSTSPDFEKSPELDGIIAMIGKAIDDVRSLTFEISPPVLHELGLGPALEWLTEQTRNRYDLNTEYQGVTLPRRLDNELAVLLFQASRELLFNVYKHAEADKVTVTLTVADGLIAVEVADDGQGFADTIDVIGHDPRTGYGLLSISERMRFLGGEMQVRSTPGHGTSVVLQAPVSYHDPAPVDGLLPRRCEAGRAKPVKDRMIRVLIADDHTLMRRGIHSILSGIPQIEIVGEAGDGLQTYNLALELRPNVIVMDIDMPEVDGIKATGAILAELPDTRVLALSMHANRSYVRQMLAAGALGYLLKDGAAEELPQAIVMVDNNRIYLSPRITGVLVDEFVRQPPEPEEAGFSILSKRELEVVRLMVNGDSTKQVALALGISQKTAQAHRQNIFRKLGISSTVELVHRAIRERLIGNDH